MKNAIVVGCNAFAQMVRYYLEEENSKNVSVVAYSVEKRYISKTIAEDGLPVLPLEDIINHAEDYDFYLAIGYSNMNKVRQNIYNSIINVGGHIHNYQHPTAVISPLACLGIGNIIFENVVIQPNVVIGNANILQASCSILHHSTLGDFNFICGGAVVNGVVNIGDRNFIGSNATLRNRVTIGSEVLIGANAYVDHSIENESVIVPQRSINLNKKSSEIKI